MSKNLPLLLDACARLKHTKRAMFGGHGLFAPNGGMFAAIVDDDLIVLKFSDDKARAGLEALGGAAWTYGGQKKPMTMREWILIPEDFYDDQELLASWAQRAHQLAPAKAAKKKTSAPKRAAPPAAKRAAAKKKTR